MRPTIALLRAAAPSRLVILAAMVGIGICARLIGFGMGSDWEGSDEQGVARMLLDLSVLPVFAAMLGGALVRGEHASWAWGLARPIPRWQLAVTTLVADALLLFAAFAVLRGILGEASVSLSQDWLLRRLLVPHHVVAPILVVIAYIGAAIGAARGHASLRAMPVGVAYGVGTLFAAAIAIWLDRPIASIFVVDAWPTPSDSGLIDGESDRYVLTQVELMVGFAAIAVAVIGGLLHGLVRALGNVPVSLRRRELLAVAGLWIAGATLLSWTLHSRLWSVGEAPRLARRGDALLVVSVDGPTQSIVLAERDCESCFARVTWDRDTNPRFDDVEAGPYRLCAEGPEPGFDPNDTILKGGIRRYTRVRTFETCTDVELVSGRNELTTAFDPTRAVPVSREGLRGEEKHRPFEGLLLARSLAELVLEAVRSDPEGRRGRRGAPGLANR